MNVALAHHKGDSDQAQRWLAWADELGGVKNHHLFVMAAKGAPAFNGPFDKWGSVKMVSDAYGVQSNWNAADSIRDASGPNSMFRQFAWYFAEVAKSGPWMFVEPDAIPLRATWLDELEAEYLASRKSFMGALIPGKPGEYDTHSTGNMILPQSAAYCEGLMVPRFAKHGERTIEIAFDVASARDVLKDFHNTKLIQQIFRGESFVAPGDLARINEGVALFHNSKDGSLIERLREKRRGIIITAPVHFEHVTQLPDGCTLEPITATKPIVHTYFSPSSHAGTRDEQEKVVSIWRKNWTDAGWDTRILTEGDAQQHTGYESFRSRFSRLPIKNPMEYEMACFLRWVAMAQVGGGLMVDYDVLNNGFAVPVGTDFRLFCGHVPCAVFGPDWAYEQRCDHFIVANVQSDMHWFEKQTSGYEKSHECQEYGTDLTRGNWQAAPLIHFAHFCCAPRKRSDVMQEWVDGKTMKALLKNADAPMDPFMRRLYIKQGLGEPLNSSDHIFALIELGKKDKMAKARIVRDLRKAGVIK